MLINNNQINNLPNENIVNSEENSEKIKLVVSKVIKIIKKQCLNKII